MVCKVSAKESFSSSKNDIPNLWTHQPNNLCIEKLSTDLDSFWLHGRIRLETTLLQKILHEQFATPQLPSDLMLISQSQHDAHLSPLKQTWNNWKYIYQKPCYNTIRCDQSIKINQKKTCRDFRFGAGSKAPWASHCPNPSWWDLSKALPIGCRIAGRCFWRTNFVGSPKSRKDS